MPRCLAISLVLLLLSAGEVWALGLGEVRLDSALNEPLRAEIELLSPTPEELDGLEVALASSETFERYGIERPFNLQDLQFQVVRSGRSDGNYILVRSTTAMTEPFLTFLVEATWPSGRLLREYTVLLDPPTFTPPASAESRPEVTAPVQSTPADSGQIDRPEPPPAVAEPAQPPAAAAPGVVPEPAAEAAPEARPEPQPVAEERSYGGDAGDEYTVARGDTLWGIASRIRPDSSLTMNQTMLAIFEANPGAFGGNINILRAGATLRIPDADAIFRIDRAQAFAEARRQNEEWRGQEASPPSPVGEPEPEPETRPSLTLVPPDEEPAAIDAGTEGDAAAEPLTREQEIEERIAEIEAADVPEQQSLIEIRDNELANLRRELAEIRGEVYEPVADEAADDPFVEDELLADDEADGELFPEFDEETTGEAAVAGSEATQEAAEPAPASSTTLRRNESGPSFVDSAMGWLSNIWVLLGIALLVVIAVLAWFLRRGGDEEPDTWGTRIGPGDAPEESMSGTESLRAPDRHDESIVVVEQDGQRAHAAEEEDTVEAESLADPDPTGRFGSLEDTFSSETAVNLDESDPIAEADFHMAYGLYDQAADLVNGALQAEPERQDLLTKLCEIYFVWGNRDSFVDSAERLQKAAGGNPDDWDKIVIMGQQIAADHELFAGAGVAGATKAVDLSFEDDATGTGALDMDFGTDAESGDEVIDLGSDAGDADDGVDFLFDEDVASIGDADADPTSTQTVVESGETDKTVETRYVDDNAGQRGDATAEIDLDDLDLGLGDDDLTELASLDDDEDTALASMDDLDETGRNEGFEPDDETGRHATADGDTGMFGSFEMEDDLTRTQSGMRLATDETGRHPSLGSDDDSADSLDLDLDMLEATGRTQVLSGDHAVSTLTGEGGDLPEIDDDDATMLSRGLDDDDFDFAKTEALPAQAYSSDETSEMPSISDGDVELDDLAAALSGGGAGDTVEQPRDDATVEQPIPSLDEDGGAGDFGSDDDTSDDISEARTMTEVGTKLDLARAYVDMGDPSGARSILEEVLDEGDAGQKQQAKQLLDSLPT
jgi:pilus assembly protein FimV